MKIKQIRNATLLINYGGRNFLIDPMFAPKESFPAIKGSGVKWPLCEMPVSPSELAKEADVIVMTHYENDHFDQSAVDTLRKGKKVFVQNDDDKELLRKLGFSNLEVLTKNGSRFVLTRVYKTNCKSPKRSSHKAMGIVMTNEEEKTLYIAGDTILCDEMKEPIEKYKPEYIIINCADERLKDHETVIMGFEDIKELHKIAPDAKIIASHLDCVGHSKLDRKALKKFVKDNKLSKFVIIPDDGETIVVAD